MRKVIFGLIAVGILIVGILIWQWNEDEMVWSFLPPPPLGGMEGIPQTDATGAPGAMGVMLLSLVALAALGIKKGNEKSA